MTDAISSPSILHTYLVAANLAMAALGDNAWYERQDFNEGIAPHVEVPMRELEGALRRLRKVLSFDQLANPETYFERMHALIGDLRATVDDAQALFYAAGDGAFSKGGSLSVPNDRIFNVLYNRQYDALHTVGHLTTGAYHDNSHNGEPKVSLYEICFAGRVTAELYFRDYDHVGKSTYRLAVEDPTGKLEWVNDAHARKCKNDGIVYEPLSQKDARAIAALAAYNVQLVQAHFLAKGIIIPDERGELPHPLQISLGHFGELPAKLFLRTQEEKQALDFIGRGGKIGLPVEKPGRQPLSQEQRTFTARLVKAQEFADQHFPLR